MECIFSSSVNPPYNGVQNIVGIRFPKQGPYYLAHTHCTLRSRTQTFMNCMGIFTRIRTLFWHYTFQFNVNHTSSEKNQVFIFQFCQILNLYLRFRRPCTVIHSYDKSQQDALFLTLFGKELYMFQTDLLSIIRSLNTVFTATGICHTVMLTVCWRGWDGTASRQST